MTCSASFPIDDSVWDSLYLQQQDDLLDTFRIVKERSPRSTTNSTSATATHKRFKVSVPSSRAVPGITDHVPGENERLRMSKPERVGKTLEDIAGAYIGGALFMMIANLVPC